MEIIMRTSYKENDVVILLKDITGMVTPEDTKTREQKIQSGTHYCEMLPVEYVPSKEYNAAYEEMIAVYSKPVAKAVCILSEKIYRKNNHPVLVSLARAGIPAGILIKRYLKKKYGVEVPHYSISIIRGRGIDKNAMKYILDRHDGKDIIFVDGWTGKGAIRNQLTEALVDYPDVTKDLAVIADPAGVAEIYGTESDLMIPSACLNSTVSGLISRTFLRDDIISETDFHGALYYGEMESEDRSYKFINDIEVYFDSYIENISEDMLCDNPKRTSGLADVHAIMEKYGVKDVNLVKPGIGETTRVLLRRVPDVVIINKSDAESEDLKPILRLAKEKNVPVKYEELSSYKVCGVIKKMADV
jgi:hypothetical protein